MNSYSPFSNDLKSLSSADLAVLREASEGWYIEYKRETPNSSSIAKSISAFANTYGGWLFYGIEEKSKEEAVAGSYPGIPRAEVDACLQRMRQAVAVLINPSPHFDTVVLWGPCEDIGLAADQAVICTHIPWSPTAPHVHKSGQIYRRVADGSEPKPESDRYILDQLWKRSNIIRKGYKKWIDDDFELSKWEQERPYIRLIFTADLWGDRKAWLDASLEEIRSIMGSEQGIISAVPFETVYSAAEGYVARQLRGNDPHDLGLTWRLRPTLESDILIPLSIYSGENPSFLTDHLIGYDGAERYINYLTRIGYKSPRIADLNFVFNIIVAIIEIQQKLLISAKWSSGFYMKARLINVWRLTPFLDIPFILDGFEQHGLPMALDEIITSPPSADPDTFRFIKPFIDIDSQEVRILLQAMASFGPIARAFGIPEWIDRNEDESPYFRELQAAGNRAKGVQNRRNRQ